MIASVLSFEKKLAPSDAVFYETTWKERDNKAIPLVLKEKSVRGTISNRLKAGAKNDIVKLEASVQSANLQKVDACSLSVSCDTLKVLFTLKILGNLETPSACNNADFAKSYHEAVRQYIDNEKFSELAKRYASNIANARFLWRNRVGSEHVEVIVKVLNDGFNDHLFTFNAFDFSLKNFECQNDELARLAAYISKALSGELPFLLLEVTAYAKVGLAQEVYPSEELVLDKGKGDKSKILYDLNGIAAMHSQKIGNAIRCIDTWYPEYHGVGTGPIAAEPYGSVTNLGTAYRNPKNKADFFTLFDKFSRGEALNSKEDEHYVIAVLIRGGVFGESTKE